MGAQLQGLLGSAGLAVFVGVFGVMTGCAARPAAGDQAADFEAPGPAPAGALPTTPPVLTPPDPPDVSGGFGPEVLLPGEQATDDAVATVGDLVLRRSHAYTRLLSAHPKLALSAVDLLVFDVLVARHAQQHGIRVSEQRIEALAAAEERTLREQVAEELGDMSFGEYVWRLFGMREQAWRASLRLRTAQRLYQGYVLRYLALREDRVRVRFLVNKDRAVAQEVVDKVKVGADFATLALRWSEDPTRRDGGLLPPFGEGFRHPAAQRAFELEAGGVCEPFEAVWGGERRWFVVYCLEHRPGRDVTFDAVRDEIDAELVERPVTPLETTAYTMRWRREEEIETREASK